MIGYNPVIQEILDLTINTVHTPEMYYNFRCNFNHGGAYVRVVTDFLWVVVIKDNDEPIRINVRSLKDRENIITELLFRK